ncbi:hypothetical protein HY947_00250 [Candidatus Gottesmanbacteria bacterium]|nr:hypothetical protein [Candidatus Gottesmanbacteria bacterium]
MKSIIFLCLVFIVAVYVFLQWNGNNKIGSNTASSSGIAMSSNSFGSVLGMNTADLQGRVASQASAVVGSVSRVVQSRIEEMVRGQVIDEVLRLYDQLSIEEKARVKEYVCK